jgi:hypothetical protein
MRRQLNEMRIWFLLSAIHTTRHYSEVFSGPSALTQPMVKRGDRANIVNAESPAALIEAQYLGNSICESAISRL